MGLIDFAGSTVVHSLGGWVSLAGIIVLGPRIGRYNRDGSPNPIPGHNIPLTALGVFIMWLGWFGFNTGSLLSGTNPAIALIAINTIVSGVSGSISIMGYTWLIKGKQLLDQLFEKIVITIKDNPELDAISIIEKEMIERAIRKTSGNKVRAAFLLGINRNTLRNKMEQNGTIWPQGIWLMKKIV